MRPNPLMNFFVRIITHRSMLAVMIKRELRFRYAGTIAGTLWSVVNPLCMILVYWFVFSVGLRVNPMGDTPFIVMFLAAYLPWSMFIEILGNSCGCILSNPHLVKKVAFPTEILPVMHIGASFVSHAVLLVVLVIILFATGFHLSIYSLQIFYYLPGLCLFSLGLSWLAAAITVFYRDMQQVVGLILNVWFWLTPIVWPLSMLSSWPRRILELNPLNYVVEGYRKSFVTYQPFWTDPWSGVLFWGVALGVFALGGMAFRRLKSEFADVL